MVDGIRLIPSDPHHAIVIYRWFAESDLTKEMIGPPHFPDHPIPSFEEFVQDYKSYFFDGSRPEKGRSYLIEYGDEMVGQINYQACEHIDNAAELDIWLSSSQFTNKGIGTKAIELMSDLLFNMDFMLLIIAPSARNIKAIKAYKKAGFVETKEYESDLPDYVDAITLIKRKK